MAFKFCFRRLEGLNSGSGKLVMLRRKRGAVLKISMNQDTYTIGTREDEDEENVEEEEEKKEEEEDE